jgi:hypothetical protein
MGSDLDYFYDFSVGFWNGYIPLTEWWLARVNAYKTITSSYRFVSDAGAPALMYVVVRSMALLTSSVVIPALRD